MSNTERVVGQNIICKGMGIGEIVDVAPLNDGGEDFYKVSFPKDKCINYYSINGNSNYRILSSQKTINKAIKEFLSDNGIVEYETLQEKINSQKEMMKEVDVMKLAKFLSHLNNESSLHPQLSKPYKDALKSFVDEISFVLDVKPSEAYSMLGMKAPKKAV